MATLRDLKRDEKVAAQPTTKAELDMLRVRAATTLSDATAAGVSAEGRYVRAYDAARQAAVIAIRASGHRVKAKLGYHAITFEALEALQPATFQAFANFFDDARLKRNSIEYSTAFSPSETDARELSDEAKKLLEAVESWIAKKHAALKA